MQSDSLLETALTQLHAALQAGDYAALDGLTSVVEKQAKQAPKDSNALVRLRDLAARNSACLMAAARGIKAARRRLGAISAAQSGLKTYDDHGQTVQIATAGPRLTQRL